MESYNFIIAGVVLAIVIVPITLVAISVNNKKRKLSQLAGQLESQYQLKFSDFDRWDNLIIGLDANARKLIWHKAEESDNESVCIDLGNIKQCNMLKDMHTVSYKGESSQALDRLALELLPKDGHSSPTVLEFYDVKNKFIINIHVQLLEKWHKLLSSQLGKATVPSPDKARHQPA